jgi:hypothetical protein
MVTNSQQDASKGEQPGLANSAADDSPGTQALQMLLAEPGKAAEKEQEALELP